MGVSLPQRAQEYKSIPINSVHFSGSNPEATSCPRCLLAFPSFDCARVSFSLPANYFRTVLALKGSPRRTDRRVCRASRSFGELTSKRIRCDSFLSVEDQITAINEFLGAWNENPKPFVWTATLDVAKLVRRQTLEQVQPGCTAPKTRKRMAS